MAHTHEDEACIRRYASIAMEVGVYLSCDSTRADSDLGMPSKTVETQSGRTVAIEWRGVRPTSESSMLLTQAQEDAMYRRIAKCALMVHFTTRANTNMPRRDDLGATYTDRISLHD